MGKSWNLLEMSFVTARMRRDKVHKEQQGKGLALILGNSSEDGAADSISHDVSHSDLEQVRMVLHNTCAAHVRWYSGCSVAVTYATERRRPRCPRGRRTGGRAADERSTQGTG
jgi:hypothetical protein